MRRGFYFTLFLLLGDSVVFGRRPDHSRRYPDDDDDEFDDDHQVEDVAAWDWVASNGILVLCLVSLVGCGLISLVTWLVCLCYKKAGKNQIGDASVNGLAIRSSSPPLWSRSLLFRPHVAGTGFSKMSKGFTTISTNSLLRTRPDTRVTDGARWGVAMTSGKHVFEITWAWGHRGQRATVGVGTVDTPLDKKGNCSLVGGCKNSWGLDIVRRQTLHDNRICSTCPTDGSFVPDKFLMYVDVDAGTLAFGNDVTHWGVVIKNLPIKGSSPLYVMIGACRPQAQVSIFYKGSASDGDTFNIGPSSYNLPPLYSDTSCLPPSYQQYLATGGLSNSSNSIDGNSSNNSSSNEEKGSVAGNQGDGVIRVIHGFQTEVPNDQTGSGDQAYEPPPPYSTPPPGYRAATDV